MGKGDKDKAGKDKKAKKKDRKKSEAAEAVAMAEAVASPPPAVEPRDSAAAAAAAEGFDLDDPHFPEALAKAAFRSGGYPYEEPLDGDTYDEDLLRLQTELVKLQQWVIAKGERLVIVFEGRDAAGKGGTIGAFREYMSPRQTRIVALPKPTEVEKGQWYFQRYVQHMPTRGEIVMFDRSWYNRAGVEPVMGFCTPEQTEQFLKEAPRFEDMLVDEGLHLVKFYIDVGFEMQLKRLHDRRHDPLKVWKVSPIDYAAIQKYDDYGAARDRMLEATHTDHAPWTVLLGNDKKRLRLAALRHVLRLFDYAGKDRTAIGEPDERIHGIGPSLVAGRGRSRPRRT